MSRTKHPRRKANVSTVYVKITHDERRALEHDARGVGCTVDELIRRRIFPERIR